MLGALMRALSSGAPEAFRSDRRHFLKQSCNALGGFASLTVLGGCGGAGNSQLLSAEGLTARVVARSDEFPTPTASHRWHWAPDGGATFATFDGGWIYVSNSELDEGGGCQALRFDANGTVMDVYPILQGTRRNCSGGATPWGTWFSCEEVEDGAVWECDPLGYVPAVQRPALGHFKHEAACVDPHTGQIYMTEDVPDGGFYRYTPASVSDEGIPDLDDGLLEIAALQDGYINWLPIPDPSGASLPTRYQLRESQPFRGGEGVIHCEQDVFFVTKRDNQVWHYNVLTGELRTHYDARGIISNADAIAASPNGDLLVAEDGSDMRIILFPKDGSDPRTLVDIIGHYDSEITGLAFDPTGTRLYFSSQRGKFGEDETGVTYELSGDFTALDPQAELVSLDIA